MPSHLTPVVFRRLISNKPIVYRGCLQQASRPYLYRQHDSKIPYMQQQRTFLDFLKPRRKAKDPALVPGMLKLNELAEMTTLKARPPPPSEIVDAFNAFFGSIKQGRVQDFQLLHIQNAFRHLQETPHPEGKPWLSLEDLRRARPCLLNPVDIGSRAVHAQFARELYEEIRSRLYVDDSEEGKHEYRTNDVPMLIETMCNYGDVEAARGTLEILTKNLGGEYVHVMYEWASVLRAYRRKHDQEGLLESLKRLRNLSVPFTPSMQAQLVRHFSVKGDLDTAKYWYNHPTVNNQNLSETGEPMVLSNWSILRLCARENDLDFGQKVINSLLKKNPDKRAWDSVFLWSAATGKGVEELDRMMQVMVRRNEFENKKARPDVDTINNLVEFAISKNDPYSAERYIVLGQKWGIHPNAKTFVLQMEYRLSVNDIDGARSSYLGLQGEAFEGDEGVHSTNKLIRAMCEAKRFEFDDIMAIVDELGERKGRFDPETVAELCMLHIRREEFHDVADLLQTHSYNYTLDERAIVCNSFVEFCLDRRNNDADVWDSYQILRSVFSETSREIRTRIMNEFFDRKRSDMAAHVFMHMKNHVSDMCYATLDTYVNAFAGIGRTGDEETLELIHNQMRLDMNIEPDTRLHNSLMLAYSAIEGKYDYAFDFWAEIVASREGPTYGSIAIIFRACELTPFGDRRARPIWEKIRSMDIDIDREILSAYIGALAGNQQHEEAQTLVERAEDEFGLVPDVLILGTWFNATFHLHRQKEIEDWIEKHYPAILGDLRALGETLTNEGHSRAFNINRNLEP